MKTIQVGLIPIAKHRLRSVALPTLVLGIVLAFFPKTEALAGPNEWLDMSHYLTGNHIKPFGHSETQQPPLSCKPGINISLNQAGYAVLTAGALMYTLNGGVAEDFGVDIMGSLEDTVFCEQIGEEVMAVVQETATGNQCMVPVNVEDKLPPVMSCTDDTLACTVTIEELSYPAFLDTLYDNCAATSSIDLTYIYAFQELDCDEDDIAGIITVEFTATDEQGHSSMCEQNIYLMKFSLDSVVFPADTTISCVDADYSVDNIGGPTIGGEPIDHLCELTVWSEDHPFVICSGSKKILREWTVMDWCTNESVMTRQYIMVTDVPPEIDCPDDLTLSNDPSECFATYTFPDPDIIDACSDPELVVTTFRIEGIFGIFSPGDEIELALGHYFLEVNATDDCDSVGTCEYTLTVVDDEDPVLVCHDFSTTLDSLGEAVIYAEMVDLHVSDNCFVDSLSIRKIVDTCENTPSDTIFGPFVTFCCAEATDSINIEFLAIDSEGNEAKCWALFEVKDDRPPDMACRDSLCIFLDALGQATITVDSIDAGSTDNCDSLNLTISQEAFDCDNEGVNVVVLTGTDQSGNSAQCSTIVTVKDTIPPTARCMDDTIMLDQTGFAMISAQDVNIGSFDNCAIWQYEVHPDTFTCLDVGPINEVTLIVTDIFGLVDSCEANVVVFDNPPEVSCMDATVELDSMGVYTLLQEDIDDAMDDCSMMLDVEITPENVSCENIGVENIVKLKVIDDFNNMDSCTAMVTVLDTIAPECLTQDITVALTDGVSILDSNEVDNGSNDECGVMSIAVSPDTFGCEDVDLVIIVTQTVTDDSGNSSACTARVFVENNEPPVCEVLQDVTVYLDEDGMLQLDSNALDAGSGATCGLEMIQISPSLFDCDNLGAPVEVVQTVVDINGTLSNCATQVTVLDTIAPICLPKDTTVYLDSVGAVSIVTANVDGGSSDNCELTIDANPKDFDCDDVGTNIVTLSPTDQSGNSSECIATVTVVDSMLPECLTVDITVALVNGAYVLDSNEVDAGSNDECGIQSISVVPNEFDCEDVGQTLLVQQTVVDDNGNVSTCTASVTIENNDMPVCEVLQDVTVYLDEDGMLQLDSNALDAGSGATCGLEMIQISPSLFDCDNLGAPVEVVQTVVDINGTLSNCTTQVTVLDTIAPICVPKDTTVYLDSAGAVSIVTANVDGGSSDNCELTMDANPKDFDCDDVGTNIVTLSATDQSGNSSECIATVTVIDSMLPECLTVDITVALVNGAYVLDSNEVDAGSNDECGIQSISVVPNEFDCEDVGQTLLVQQTVIDDNGNVSTCTASVTIENNDMPVCEVLQDVTVHLDETGIARLDSNELDAGSSASCDIMSIELSQDTFDCTDVGQFTMVIQSVTDINGVMSTCTTTIITLDTISPTCITKDTTVYLDGSGMASIITSDVNNGSFDNCGVINDANPKDFSCENIGPNTVTLNVSDPSGNTTSCDATVTVSDTTAPTCVAVDTFVLVLDGEGMGTIDAELDINSSSSDNCSIVLYEVDQVDYDCDDLGPVDITLTVTDQTNNSSSCASVVKVEDNGGFDALCKDITVELDSMGQFCLIPDSLDNGSGGGCGTDEVMFELDQDKVACDDADMTVIVKLYAFNELDLDSCETMVTVEDNIAPMISCPVNVDLQCGDEVPEPGNLEQFGSASADDNCPPPVVTDTAIYDFNQCGTGTITRIFTATDASGNTATCEQVISFGSGVLQISDITWPTDVTLPSCSTNTDTSNTGVPIINVPEGTCALTSMSFSDSEMVMCEANPATPCTVITRMWTVIDSCQLDGTTGGVFNFSQEINITSAGPVFSAPGDITIMADPQLCMGVLENYVAMATSCEGAVTDITNDYNDGGADASDNYIIGTTQVTFTATDECCKESQLVVNVTVVDAGTPTFTCFKPITQMVPELFLTRAAREFVIFSNDDGCQVKSDFFYSYSIVDISDSITFADCGDVGTFRYDIFIWNESMEIDTMCRADWEIIDDGMFCPTANLTVSGDVYNEAGLRLANIPVYISEAGMVPEVTTDEGAYAFGGLDAGVAYEVAPVYDEKPLQGVSTLDLVELQKHLLGIKKLDSPYKRIAADVNNNGTISALDLVHLRRALLGDKPALVHNTSWRFVEAGYEFPDWYNPFATSYPESTVVDEMWTDAEAVDFIGVKIGDLNNSYVNAKAEKDIKVRSAQDLILGFTNHAVSTGEVVQVPVYVSYFDNIAGFQFTIGVDADATSQFDVLAASSDASLDLSNFGLHRQKDGLISVSWSAPIGRTLNAEQVLFVIEFQAIRDLNIADVLELNSDLLRKEAYIDGEEIRTVSVGMISVEQQSQLTEANFTLHQNRPNPFADVTSISFNLPYDSEVKFEVHRANGALIYLDKKQLSKGAHAFEMTREHLSQGGVYFYTLTTEKHRVTRKMMLLD